MTKTILILLTGLLFLSCKDEKNNTVSLDENIKSMISKDKFKSHRIGRTLSFIRDESNKVIGWSDGINTIKKIDVND